MRIIPIAALCSLAIGFASPALAQYGPQYSPSATGGGSAGYNHGLRYYRLKKHHPVTGKNLHNQARPAKSSSATPSAGGQAAGGGTPGAAGGAAAKQPMGRP